MKPRTDEDICRQFLADPHQSFALVYQRYAGPLFRFVYRFTANRERAEEILQDVFTQLLDGRFRDSSEANLKAWLFTLARNCSLNAVKKSRRERADEAVIAQAVSPQNLEEELMAHQNHQRLEKTLAELPPDLAGTLVLRRSGQDYQQIAKSLGIPVGTVKSRFFRLTEYLKKELK